jgi:hypothetical protein
MRSVLLPLEGCEVHFSGKNRGQNRDGHMCLRPVDVDGQYIDHLWLRVSKSDILKAPMGSMVSGYALIKRYLRASNDTEDLGLFRPRELQVSLKCSMGSTWR